jgi:hypothetical protein
MATGKQISNLEERLRRLECCCIKEIPTTSGEPTEAPPSNQVFAFDPDTGILYYYDGDSWEVFSGGSESNYVNIEDFGADTAAADNRLFIQAAIDEAALVGLPVYIPEGTYTISTLNGSNRGLEIPSGVKIFGEGNSSVISDTDTTASHVFILVDGIHVELSNFKIEGNNTSGTSAINVNTAADYVVIDQIEFEGGFGWNVFSYRNESPRVSNCIMEHVGSANCIEFNECIRGTIVNNHITGNTLDGGAVIPTSQAIEIYNLAAATVKGHHYIAGNTIRLVRRGIALVADDNSVITGNRIEEVGEMGIHIIISNNIVINAGHHGSYPGIQAHGDNIKIVGNTIMDSNIHGIVNNSPGGLISNNHIYDSGSYGIFNATDGINASIVGNVAINGTRGIVNEADFVTITGNIAGEDSGMAAMDIAIFNDAAANDVTIAGNTTIGGFAVVSNSTTNVSIYGNSARIGGKLNVNATDNTNTVEIGTSVNDDGIRIKGSGVGGPTFRLDATNATPANRYSAYNNVWGGTDTWGMGFRGTQNWILRNYITGTDAITVDVATNSVTNKIAVYESAGGIPSFSSGFFAYTGAGADSWALPTIAASQIGIRYEIKNRGGGNLTITVTGGGSTLYDSAAVASVIIPPGDSRVFIQDSTYWNIN